MNKALFTLMAAGFLAAIGMPRWAHADGPLPNILFQDPEPPPPTFYIKDCGQNPLCCCDGSDTALGGSSACPFGAQPAGDQLLPAPSGDIECGSAGGYFGDCYSQLPLDVRVSCVHQQ